MTRMTGARTRSRDRRQQRRQRRLARERRDDDRMTGFALAHAENHDLLRVFLGERRAYKLLAVVTAITLGVWVLQCVLG